MGKLPYFTTKTEQKQRGFIIANEFGGPLDVTSWVAYKSNLDKLPNLYEGKLAYVYEDNQIYVCTEDTKTELMRWDKLTNNINVLDDVSNTRFMLLFYEGNNDIPIDTIYDDETHSDKEIQARLYIEMGEESGKFRRYNNTYDISSGDKRYNRDLKYYWYKNNFNNTLDKIQNTREFIVNTVNDNIYVLSDELYENGYIICVITQTIDGVESIIACNRLRFKNQKEEADDKSQGMYYLNSKSSMLQRGFLMTNEQGGGVDATSSVNSTDDLVDFTNNYLGKMVYSYTDDEYMFYSNDNNAIYPPSSYTQEDKVKFVKDHASGSWTPIGPIDVKNNVSIRWEITGRNYSKSYNGITKDNNGKVLSIKNEEDWRPEQLQERYDNGQMAQYEAHLYITVNGVEHEVDRSTSWAAMTNIGTNITGQVYYKWTVKKPTDEEYYDRENDYEDGVPVRDPDQNRTVWIRDVDFKINGGSYSNDIHRGGTIVAIDGSSLDFKNSPYVENSEHYNDDFEHHMLEGVESKENSYSLHSNYMEILYTNDYADADIAEITCTVYFKDENGIIRYIDSPTYPINIAKEHLVYILAENKGDTGMKYVVPDEGKFVIDGGAAATIDDFTLSNNEYKIGYGIMYYPNEQLARQGYYPHNHTKGDPSQGTLVYELYFNDNNEKVLLDSIVDLHEPTPISTKSGTFDFRFTTKSRYNSKMPFGWYKLFVFRRTIDDDLLYESTPYHYYQTISNGANFVYPEKVWMGYYQLNSNHEYQGTIEVRGTNLLYKDIPIIEDGELVKKYTDSVLYTKPLNIWTPCTNNAEYTKINAIQPFTDPRPANYVDTHSKDRHIEVWYYSENDMIVNFIDAINVYNVVLPDLDTVIDSIYKWPDGKDIFIYNTSGYTITNPVPYGVPVIDSPDQVAIEDTHTVVSNFRCTLHGESTETNPKLRFNDTFEMKADVINKSNVITDRLSSITGRTFSPTVYDLKITIEQPSIQNDSDYYETDTMYQLISHIWYRTSENAEWREFTQDQLGTVEYTWKEKDNQDIFFSNTNTQLATQKKVTGTNTNGGYNNIWFNFHNNKFVFCYVQLNAKVFGYEISTVDEIKVRNPIDVLDVSHKIYTGTRDFKDYGIQDTRQLESEWIELTITPTLVEWFNWSDITTTLKFLIDGEEVDESSTKYKIEYSGTRNHFYEGTFKVIWKNNNDLPDNTLTHVISLNKCVNNHVIPVVLVKVNSMNIYPLNHNNLNIGYPAIDNVFINAKVGTAQRYVLVIEGIGLDDDPRFLTLSNEGFKETRSGATSLGSTIAKVDRTTNSTMFKRVTDTPTKIIYYINESATTNTLYTVKYVDAYNTTTRTAKTYVYNNDSISAFYTTSAYYEKSNGTTLSFLDPKWINVLSTFSPSYTYIPVVVEKSVIDNTTKFTSYARYDLHNIGIVSGDNILVKSKDDTKHVYTASISRSYDIFTAVLKDFSTDVSSSLPSATRVAYSWSHTGPCRVESPTNTMDKNYLNLYNDSDADVNENVNLNVTILYHVNSFENWQGNTLTISDYVLNAKSNNQNMPKLLYKIEFVKNNINLDIDKEYAMSDIFESITTTMYRYDLDHIIEKKTWRGSDLNNAQLVYSVENVGSKPASMSSAKKLKVTSDKGADVKVEWKKTGTDTKTYGTVSYTSNIIKESIVISPTSNSWDLKVVPVIEPVITLKGQNLKYAYSVEGNDFLYVVENGYSTHKASFDPSITSNAYGTYNIGKRTYTDTNHNFGYNSSGAEIDDETRKYVYYFGSKTATYTATYQNKKVTNITFTNPCIVTNNTYSSISASFDITSVNMFGPNVDIHNYDLTWSSAPSGSTVTGTFDSAGGEIGSGTLTLSQKKLTADQSISVTVQRENKINTYTGVVNVSRITGIDTNTSKTYMSKNSSGNPVLTVTFNGQHLNCSNTTYYVGISNNGTNYAQLGSFTISSATSNTGSFALPDKTTYHAGATRYIKVWMSGGDLSSAGTQDGQYATHTFAAQNPDSLSISLVAGSASVDTVDCNVLDTTLRWKGNVTAIYADGTTNVLVTNGDYNKGVSFGSQNCCKTGNNTISFSTNWQLAAGSYNSRTASNIVAVSANGTQRGDSVVSDTYGNSSCSQTSYAAAGGTGTISGTRNVTWSKCGAVETTVSEQYNTGNNKYNTSSKTVTIKPSWDASKTCTVTLNADTCTCSKLTSSDVTLTKNGNRYEGSVSYNYNKTITISSDCKWEDSTACGSSKSVSITSNAYSTSAKTYTGTLSGMSYLISQAGDKTSCSYSSCTYNALASTPSNVSCSAGSKTISVTGYRYYICKWQDGTQASSTRYNDCSTSCTKTYTSNCSSASDKTISGTCEGVSYSFTQAGDICEDCTPSGGTVTADNSYFSKSGAARTLYVTGRTCTRYYKYGKTSCGTKSDNKECVVYPDCNNKTQSCGAGYPSYTFDMPSGLHGISIDFFGSVSVNSSTGIGLATITVSKNYTYGYDYCDNKISLGPSSTDDHVGSGYVYYSINNGGNVKLDLTGDVTTYSFPFTGSEDLIYAFSDGKGTTAAGNSATFKCDDTGNAGSYTPPTPVYTCPDGWTKACDKVCYKRVVIGKGGPNNAVNVYNLYVKNEKSFFVNVKYSRYEETTEYTVSVPAGSTGESPVVTGVLGMTVNGCE